jgi:hypothetical protein
VALSMAKKTKLRSLARWHISLPGTPSKFLGIVEARDTQAAIQVAIMKYRVSNTLQQKRIMVRPERGKLK